MTEVFKKVILTSNVNGTVFKIEGDVTDVKATPRGSILFAKDHFKNRDNLVIAEIGVQCGLNAEYIWNELHPKLLVLIDSWDASGGQMNNLNFVETWHRLHGKREIIFIKGWSSDVSRILGLQFDFIYIDGDHAEVMVRGDILSWLPKVKSGGLIGGHDFDHPAGVAKAVNGVFGERVITRVNGSKLIGDDWMVLV